MVRIIRHITYSCQCYFLANVRRKRERRQWLPDMQQGAATEFQRKMGLTHSDELAMK